MLRIISNSFVLCNHTNPRQIGIAPIIPIIILGTKNIETKEAIYFINQEYNEYFQIVSKKNLSLNKKISNNVYDYKIDIISIRIKKIILFKKDRQKLIFHRNENQSLEQILIKICNELIASYRNLN